MGWGDRIKKLFTSVYSSFFPGEEVSFALAIEIRKETYPPTCSESARSGLACYKIQRFETLNDLYLSADYSCLDSNSCCSVGPFTGIGRPSGFSNSPL